MSLVLAVVVVLYPVMGTSAAVSTKPPAASRMVVKAGDVRFRVLSPTGDPVKGVPVEILDAQGRATARAVTGEDGRCVLKGLAAGDYRLKAGVKPLLPVEVAEKGGLENLLLVVPAADGEEGSFLGLTGTQLTWVVVGGVAVATAITLPIALHDDDDDDEEAAAATTPTVRRRARRVSP